MGKLQFFTFVSENMTICEFMLVSSPSATLHQNFLIYYSEIGGESVLYSKHKYICMHT